MHITIAPWQRLLPALLLTLAGLSGAHAQDSNESAREAAAAKAWADARSAAKSGPQDIAVAGQATLHLPDGEVFIPQPQAASLMQAMGNPGEHSDLQGLVFPKGEDARWFATLRYEPAGYVKDGDAKEWKADELLQSYREGTEANNAERAKLGVPALEITGWAEPPKYDEATHRLVWAMASRTKDAPADEEPGVNYNTYALGREGYISLNLVTELKTLPTDKTEAQRLLGALDFNEGKRYSDFNSGTDKVAEYGLAALVLGVGAKKLGLLAVAFAFLAKFAKLIAFGVFAFGATFMKFFRRNKRPTA